MSQYYFYKIAICYFICSLNIVDANAQHLFTKYYHFPFFSSHFISTIITWTGLYRTLKSAFNSLGLDHTKDNTLLREKRMLISVYKVYLFLRVCYFVFLCTMVKAQKLLLYGRCVVECYQLFNSDDFLSHFHHFTLCFSMLSFL